MCMMIDSSEHLLPVEIVFEGKILLENSPGDEDWRKLAHVTYYGRSCASLQ
jgi:hypothetical protein